MSADVLIVNFGHIQCKIQRIKLHLSSKKYLLRVTNENPNCWMLYRICSTLIINTLEWYDLLSFFDDFEHIKLIKQFQANASFLHPMKTQENIWFSNVFRGIEMKHWYEIDWSIDFITELTLILFAC